MVVGNFEYELLRLSVGAVYDRARSSTAPAGNSE
jgi:hypothetical protein